ncbi:uncharacterized protein LOC142209967 [Leptodactylus fuscus]|uniref:uncharacterized protein LOC142209967 n=1 Tax=Leptodactylus fuscus TaxID=238119 RepID=UPI003F4EBBA7
MACIRGVKPRQLGTPTLFGPWLRGFVVLALLFLTGTQARYSWQRDEPQSHAQHVREVIESYLNNIRDLGREAVSQAESSDLGKQLVLKITERLETLSSNVLALKKQLNPYVDRVRKQVSAELEKDIPLLRQKIRHIVKNFQKNWAEELKAFKESMSPFGDELTEQTKDNIEDFHKKLQQLAENLREKLRSAVDAFRANLVLYSDELMRMMILKLEELRANAGPKAGIYKAKIAKLWEAARARLQQRA